MRAHEEHDNPSKDKAELERHEGQVKQDRHGVLVQNVILFRRSGECTTSGKPKT